MVTIAAILGTHYLNGTKKDVESKREVKPVPIQQPNENQKSNAKMIESESRDSELATMQLDCGELLRPVPWNSDTLHVLETYPTLTKNFVEMTSSSGKPRVWPDNYKPDNRLYRCDVTNYGSAAVFGLSMEFTLTFLEAVKVPDNPKARKGGAALSTHSHLIEVPVIDGNAGKFVFYLHNQSEYFVNVAVPEFATLEVVGKIERQRIRFKPPTTNWPRVFFLSPKVDVRNLFW